jgi:hypothetical protein
MLTVSLPSPEPSAHLPVRKILLSCSLSAMPQGGFVHARHNEVQELFALECSKAGFNDTELEPPLLPVEDERID